MWLHRVLVVACGIFQLCFVGSSSPTGIEPRSLALGVLILKGK